MRADMQSEFLPRSRRKRRVFWYAFGTAVLFIVLIGSALYFLRTSPWLKVKQFAINGTDTPTSTVLAALKADWRGGLWQAFLGPDNILTWQFGRAPDLALSLPLVASLDVKPNIWARTVAVTAADRSLWAIVCEPAGACYAVDRTGMVFAQVPQTQGVLILKIDDQSGRTLVLGEPFLPSAGWIKNFTTTIATLNATGYPVASASLDDLAAREWHVRLLSGVTMDFSFDFVPDNLAAVLGNLRSTIDLAKVSDVDFSVPQRIYYK